MALSPELLALKLRVTQALQMRASVARVDAHLDKLGAGKVPAGKSKEQHLLDVLVGLETGTWHPSPKPALAKIPTPAPKAVEPPPAPASEPVKVEEPAPVAEAPVEEPKAEEPAPEPVKVEEPAPEASKKSKKKG